MCQPQFEPLILSGVKTHTIRPPRKGRRWAEVLPPGTRISLRVWTGKPYRSKQREIKQVSVKFVFPVEVRSKGLWRLDRNHPLSTRKISHGDGFVNWPAMRKWFSTTHGLPFEGELIHWEEPA